MSDRDEQIISRLRRAYEAFNEADFDTAIEIAHPEVEFLPPGGQPPLKGADALRAWMEPDAFQEQQIQAREFRIHGNKVLIRHHAHARGAGSGIELETEAWVVWTLDDGGLVTRIESFLPHQETEAFEAAGVSE